jgi:deoxyribonuclease-4
MSVSGGLHRAFDRIDSINGQAMQIFTRNQRQWAAPPITEQEQKQFQKKISSWAATRIASHASYLINLATPDPAAAQKSCRSFADELERCASLSIPYVVIHPGSHLGSGTDTAVRNLAGNLDNVFSMISADNQVMVLLETTAGQGTGIGSRFEDLAAAMEHCSFPERLGVCLDTCHIFAAGYDISNEKGYGRTMNSLDRLIGLDRLKFFHLNDSKKELGSRVDRHEHIGKGQIGLTGFRLLLNDDRFADHPMVLETPKDKDMTEDIINLRLLRSLMDK